MNCSEFAAWAGCNIGSFVAYDSETQSRMTFPGAKEAELEASLRALLPDLSIRMSSDVTVTLLERGPDHIVLEAISRLTVNGRTEESRRREIFPAVPAPEEPVREISRQEDGDGGYAEVVKMSWDHIFKDAATTVGQETLEIAGRALPCSRVEKSTEGPMGRVQMTTWNSPEIPGGCARSVFLTSGHSEQTITMKVRAFERK